MAAQLERSQAGFALGPHVEAFTAEGRELVTNRRLTIAPSFAEVDISGGQKILRGKAILSMLTDLAVAAQLSEAVSLTDLAGTIVVAGSASADPRQMVSGYINYLRFFLEDSVRPPELITVARIEGETHYRLNLPSKAISFIEDRPVVPRQIADVAGNGAKVDFSLVDPQEVARRVAQRDGQAFAHLYETHLNTVLRFVFFKVGDATLAEDLTAEVFSKAWENIDQFEWRDLPFKHWLLRVARNEVVDHWREHRRFPTSLDGLYEQPSDVPTPEEIVARDAEVERVRLAMKSLTDDQRDVLILRFIEGYSHADTAQVLGKSVVAVRQLQVRVIRELRRKLMVNEMLVRKR